MTQVYDVASIGLNWVQQAAAHPYVFGEPALLIAAGVGHDTVRAAFIAAMDDIDPGCEVAVAPGHSDVLLQGDLLCGHHLRPLVHLLQQLVYPAGQHLLSANTGLIDSRHRWLQVRPLSPLLAPLLFCNAPALGGGGAHAETPTGSSRVQQLNDCKSQSAWCASAAALQEGCQPNVVPAAAARGPWEISRFAASGTSHGCNQSGSVCMSHCTLRKLASVTREQLIAGQPLNVQTGHHPRCLFGLPQPRLHPVDACAI